MGTRYKFLKKSTRQRAASQIALVLSIIISYSSPLTAGETIPAVDSTDHDTASSFRCSTRSHSFFGTVGVLQLLSVGINFQLSDEYSLGVVGSGFIIGGPASYGIPNGADGIGFRGSYYFSRDGTSTFLKANVLSLDIQYLGASNNSQKHFPHNEGIGIEFAVGRDNIVYDGTGVIWGLGIAAAIHTDAPALVFPVVRFGVHMDFLW